ncbi:MAG: M20/M25/M40 family metallo-hydrolase [Acidobacteria bacterium]|nr:M20/M25/M40 family metallo-hydrolase [Acidobacteriota bacterium]
MRTGFWLAVAGALVVASVLAARDRPGSPRPDVRRSSSGPALDEIRAGDVAAHLRFLADDLLEGRAPSTRGGQLAATYLAAQLAVLGYEPAGDAGTYFQDVAIVESVVNPSFTLAAGPGAPFPYLEDVVAFSDVQEPRVAAAGEVVFVGHGIVAPEYAWNDYAGIDMTGKVALVMVNDPPATADEPQLFGGRALTYYGRWTYKFEEAARQGAGGAILIHTDESATYPWQVVRSSWSGTQYSIPAVAGVPQLALKAWVTDRAAREIARRAGRDLDALRKTAATRGARPVPLGIRASATIAQTVQRKASPNVIGVLRGTSGAEGVVYTAHYDHLGTRDPQPADPQGADRIYNGALDNASGLAGTLEVAQALARGRTRPARSIYILFTTAEEAGLLGAQYFAGHPVLPAAAWAADINIDELNMAGPSRDIVLLGAERSTLGALASQLAAERGRTIGPDPDPGAGHFFRSDHFPLAKVGIPAVSLSQPADFNGRDPEGQKKVQDEYEANRYHQPSDQILPGWDYTGAVNDLRFLAELGWRIANLTPMPAYHSNEQFARPRIGVPPTGAAQGVQGTAGRP